VTTSSSGTSAARSFRDRSTASAALPA
jgi:hypothetical protein